VTGADAAPRAGVWPAVKRAMDVLGAAVLLLLLSPLLLVLAAAVWLDSGRPVLYFQERLGRGGRVFRMAKFRTMRTGKEGAFTLNADGSLKIREDDARITRIGHFLRRYSLDELPQLTNVLRGDMSLVGPRPDLPFHRDYYDPDQARKLLARPGITGLAQVSGRNSLPWGERLKLDVEYVNRSSLPLDLRILLLTVLRVVRPDGIYGERASGAGG
jgi:lipopolysaccharide/colanic/teichoic acid biosynthesis glycosyltransferase